MPAASAASCSSGSGCQRCWTAAIRKGWPARRPGAGGRRRRLRATIRRISSIHDCSPPIDWPPSSPPAGDGCVRGRRQAGAGAQEDDEADDSDRVDAGSRRLPDAGRVRAPRRLLDGLARAARQLAPRSGAGPGGLCGGGEAIAASEPVTMAVSDAQFERCRARLSPAVRVVEISTDDAWMRDTGPTFVVDGAGGRRGVDWRFNAWGGPRGRPLLPLGPRRPGRRQGAGDRRAPTATGRRSCSRAARSTSTARARC